MMNDPFLAEVGVTNEQGAMHDSIGSAVKVRGGTKVYRDGADERNKSNFRQKWAELIRKEAQRYVKPTQPISDAQHCEVIRRISESLSSSHRELLKDGELRHGISQKAFNLYLKYLWRLGKIPAPPHCPVDGVVLREAGIVGSWTASNSEAEYLGWIKALRIKTQPRSLAEWENDIWLRDLLRRRSAGTAGPPRCK